MANAFENLKNDHHKFDKNSLVGVPFTSPCLLFEKWYAEAAIAKVNEPNAFSLSTVSADGQPSSRVVYLKEFIDQEFIFYTNFNSQKGRHIVNNPKVSILFFWPELERQIRIEGVAHKISNDLSDSYFASRPRESQLGAWVSEQSETLESENTLNERQKEFQAKFPNNVPRPPHWGGYAIVPHLMEFWQGRPSRLHDRLIYQKNGEAWQNYRKNP